LEAFGPLVDILADGMAGGNTRTRLGIIDTMAGLRGPKVVETLFAVLGDPATEIRLSAATALAAMPEADVHRRLHALADTEDVGAQEVRQALHRRAGMGDSTAGASA
jgi:hypothetical protein